MGIKCTLQHTVKQSQPLTSELLQKLEKFIDRTDQKEVAVWTTTLFRYHLFLIWSQNHKIPLIKNSNSVADIYVENSTSC